MPLPQPRTPRPHRARRTRRHAAAMASAAGRRAVRRPPLLSAAGGPHPAALSLAALAALASLAVAARAGALTHLWEFLDYGAGVLSLVSLTSAVLWGLVATDRTLLASGHRLVAQGVHRALAVAGLAFLAVHIWVKVALARTVAASVVVPFADPDRPLLIGLGTLAGYLFVAVAASGAARSAFATKGRSPWWRALHMGAYPAWGASLVHGLQSGRAASGWVTVAYALCLAGVAGVLAVRLRARLRAQPARPAVAQPPAPRTPGQGPPRTPRPFVRRPAEWAAARLTARLARQSQRRPQERPLNPAPGRAEAYAEAYPGGSPAEGYPGQGYPAYPAQGYPASGTAPEPSAEPLLVRRAAAGPVVGSRPAPPPAGPAWQEAYPSVFIPSGLGTPDRPGEPLGGARGRQ